MNVNDPLLRKLLDAAKRTGRGLSVPPVGSLPLPLPQPLLATRSRMPVASAVASSAEPAVGRGEFQSRTFANEAGRRDYKLYVPSGERVRALPLLVMLHGCHQSPDDFAAGTRMNALADEQHFLVAYPAQSTAANPAKCWNWFNAADQQRGAGEPALLAGMTRQIMRDFPVDPDRVYVAGLSAGGAAAAVLGATYPDLYAAIGVHSGIPCGSARDLTSALATMRQGGPINDRARNGTDRDESGLPIVPTIVFHGDRDGTVHPRNGEDAVARHAGAVLQKTVERGGVPGGHTYTRTRYGEPGERAPLEHWVVHGAKHAWSGGSGAGSYTDPQGPDAAREMLRFFAEHSRPSVVRRA